MTQLINLQTKDRNLDELIITEYSGKLLEKNRKVRITSQGKLYCFFGLEKAKLKALLHSLKNTYSYSEGIFLGYPNELDDSPEVSLN